MDFSLSEEQSLIVSTTRAFVENELYPHEQEIERSGVLEPDPDPGTATKIHAGRAIRRQHSRGIWWWRPRYPDLAFV